MSVRCRFDLGSSFVCFRSAEIRLIKECLWMAERKVVVADALQIDFGSRTMKSLTGESGSVDITDKAFQILDYLLVNKNIVCSHDAIFNAVWGDDSETLPDSAVKREISNLRGQLKSICGEELARKIIVTKRGGGYLLDGSLISESWRDAGETTVGNNTGEQDGGGARAPTSDSIHLATEEDVISMAKDLGIQQMLDNVRNAAHSVAQGHPEDDSEDFDYIDDDYLEWEEYEEFKRLDWVINYRFTCITYYSKVNVFMYQNEEVDFDDAFVCCDMGYERDGKLQYIRNASIEDVTGVNDHVVIIGPGGIGKTMMMTHLFLDALDKAKNQVPVFISLVDYVGGELIDYIADEVNNNCADVKKGQILYLMEKGRLLLFLDAFDEIKEEYQEAFDKERRKFDRLYRGNQVVMSCRELLDEWNFGSFKKMVLYSFTLPQLRTFINLCGVPEGDMRELMRIPIIKSIADATDNRLAIYQEAISRNSGYRDDATPLIISAVILTYREEGIFDVKFFYDDAFMVMVKRHDANKQKKVQRKYRTNLRPLELKEKFAEFCYNSYMRELFRFREHDVYDCSKNLGVYPEAFLEDLLERACMLVRDGRRFKFLHRNFQQYFCARFMCDHTDKIGEYYRKVSTGLKLGESTMLQMLVDLDKFIVEKYIYLPYLEELMDGDFWDYMEMTGAVLDVVVRPEKVTVLGQAADYRIDEMDVIGTISSIHDWIMTQLDIDKKSYRIVSMEPVKGMEGEWLYEEHGSRQPLHLPEKSLAELGADLNSDKYSYYGMEYQGNVSEFKDAGNDDLMELIEDDGSVYKKQYNRIKAYYEQLKQKYPGGA